MKTIQSYIFQTLLVAVCMLMTTINATAQTDVADMKSNNDSVSAIFTQQDTLRMLAQTDSVKLRKHRDWKTWRPNPKRAMWLAIVLPGAGQIYNRKYWKVPIVYGGFVGCAYAMRWNNQMFRD